MDKVKAHIKCFAACLLVLLPLFFIACGPTVEQIRAREEQRQRSEESRIREAEARRVAEEGRRNRIRAATESGNEAARNQQFDVAFKKYSEALTEVQRYSEEDSRIRETIVRLAASMPSPPPAGDEALRFMVRGQAKVKMGGMGSYETAVEEMEKAIKAAPWWADGYFNLGLIQEKAGQYPEALGNLNLYLLAAPRSPDAKAVQMKIYEIEVAKEVAEKNLALQGTWRNAKDNSHYEVSLDGGKKMVIKATGRESLGYSIKVDKNGQGLEGFITIPGRHYDYCDLPGETNPVVGTVADDGSSIELRFQISRYSTSNRFVGLSLGGWECTGVTLLNKDDATLRLEKVR